MDDITIFGQVYEDRQRPIRRGLGVRFYKGERVPWIPHDCTESNSCSFCRNRKRTMAAKSKSKDS